MIRITNIQNAKNVGCEDIWAIVRSMKSPEPGIVQVTGLSPSKELFHKYRNLVLEEDWHKQTFQDIYVPQFLLETCQSQVAKNLLNRLYQMDKEGKDICLACFCVNETLCHRSIIAGLLQGVGCNVVTDTGNDYTAYYRMYRKTEAELKRREL